MSTPYEISLVEQVKTEKALKRLLDKFATDWTAFNDTVINFPIPAQPTPLSESRSLFRGAFMHEELTEFHKACGEGDLDGQVDALIDLIYVAVGTLGEMGVCTQPSWDAVQEANMSKRRGSLSKRPDGGGFDAVKPEGWTAPNHLPFLDITTDDVKLLALMKQPQKRVGLDDTILAVTFGGDAYYNLTRDELLLLNIAKDQARGTTPIPEIGPAPDKRTIASKKPRLLILGHGRHGKDTVCELLRDQYDLKFTSSSWFCAERVMMPHFNDNGGLFSYQTVQECYDDRHNHRAEWYEAIRDFNRPDATALGRAIFAENDVYCGLRSKAEFHALKNTGAFDYAIWVDASDRVAPEDARSCTVEPWMADFVLDNNGSIKDLHFNLQQLMEGIL